MLDHIITNRHPTTPDQGKREVTNGLFSLPVWFDACFATSFGPFRPAPWVRATFFIIRQNLTVSFGADSRTTSPSLFSAHFFLFVEIKTHCPSGTAQNLCPCFFTDINAIGDGVWGLRIDGVRIEGLKKAHGSYACMPAVFILTSYFLLLFACSLTADCWWPGQD